MARDGKNTNEYYTKSITKSILNFSKNLRLLIPIKITSKCATKFKILNFQENLNFKHF